MAATVLIAALLMLCKGRGTSSSLPAVPDITLLGRMRTFEGSIKSGARNLNVENISESFMTFFLTFQTYYTTEGNNALGFVIVVNLFVLNLLWISAFPELCQP